MTLRFGDFEIDLDRQELRDSTGPVDVEPQVFRLLGYLIEQRDRVVSKDELVEKVWSGRFVSDATVTSRINLLRKTVGDSGSAQSVIKTFSKRGYRFVADIVQTGAQNAEAPRDVPAITPVSPKVVVLPFVRLGGDDADFLAEGTTEEITVALSRCSDVAVIANRSARAVAEESTVVSEIGRELGAQYVVRGSVQRSAAQVRVTAQLVDTRIGKHLWAEVFTGAAAEIFEIQESVARSLAAVLPGRISASNARRDPPGGDAGLSEYGAFWQVMNTLRTDGDVAAACQKLRAIAALYEGFALVHAQLAVLLGFLPFTLGQDDPARVATSVEHAKLALALEPGDERVHAKAALAFLDAGEFALALRHSLISLDLNPNSVEAMHFRGCILCSTGDPDAALEMQQRAMRLDPLFPTHYYENLMEAHYLKGRYAAALAVLEGWDRPHFHVMGTAAACHAMLGNAKQAADYASRFHAASPEGFRIKDYVGAVMRYHMHEEDRAHWLTGFRRSGVL